MEESRAHGNGMHIGFQDFCIFIAVLDPAISWSTATVEVIEVDQWLCSFEEQDEREGHPDVPAISTQGVAAGACYGRPLSKQKLENLTAHPKGRTARARDRLPTARKLRPLPLEMRVSIEDSGGRREGASQPSSWGSTSLSSRRGRKTSKGRAEEETSDSVTPSPTEAAKRRQAHTMKTLHKTAEIYGAPDAVGHTLRHVDAMTSLMGRRVISWTTRLDV
ncbi:Uncharacterized protein SCF082_LOCUS35713 [Durusdinium trenchii]|uniref:Uncharacterized protein n=1 Tax=Durusdinium trenchii TaxID=1381693 RepID=A0ABP0P9D6_9DINO